MTKICAYFIKIREHTTWLAPWPWEGPQSLNRLLFYSQLKSLCLGRGWTGILPPELSYSRKDPETCWLSLSSRFFPQKAVLKKTESSKLGGSKCVNFTIERIKVKWKSLSRVQLLAISPGQNTGVGSLSLLQGIFPTQGWNPSLLHCRQILYQLSHKGSPERVKPLTKAGCIHRGSLLFFLLKGPWSFPDSGSEAHCSLCLKGNPYTLLHLFATLLPGQDLGIC